MTRPHDGTHKRSRHRPEQQHHALRQLVDPWGLGILRQQTGPHFNAQYESDDHSTLQRDPGPDGQKRNDPLKHGAGENGHWQPL